MILEIQNMPDLGLKFPEKKEEQELLRQAVVDCVHYMFCNDNVNSFVDKALEMFRLFGIEPPDETDGYKLKSTLDNLKMCFNQVKRDPKMERHPGTFDIVVQGKKAYANLYFRVHSSSPLLVEVCPGACSLPGKYPSENIDRNPEANFYIMAEKLLGVDLELGEINKSIGKVNEHDKFSFLITEQGYQRIPVSKKDQTIKELSRTNLRSIFE